MRSIEDMIAGNTERPRVPRLPAHPRARGPAGPHRREQPPEPSARTDDHHRIRCSAATVAPGRTRHARAAPRRSDSCLLRIHQRVQPDAACGLGTLEHSREQAWVAAHGEIPRTVTTYVNATADDQPNGF